jgi:hypothetical protein
VVAATERIDAQPSHTCPPLGLGIYGAGGHLWSRKRDLILRGVGRPNRAGVSCTDFFIPGLYKGHSR